MVMKVKKKSEKMRITLPPDSQNSASPYAFTARMFRSLVSNQYSALQSQLILILGLPIKHDAGNRRCPGRDVVSPEPQDRGEGGDLERNQKGFIDEDCGKACQHTDPQQTTGS